MVQYLDPQGLDRTLRGFLVGEAKTRTTRPWYDSHEAYITGLRLPQKAASPRTVRSYILQNTRFKQEKIRNCPCVPGTEEENTRRRIRIHMGSWWRYQGIRAVHAELRGVSDQAGSQAAVPAR